MCKSSMLTLTKYTVLLKGKLTLETQTSIHSNLDLKSWASVSQIFLLLLHNKGVFSAFWRLKINLKNNGATKQKSETPFCRSIYVDQIQHKKVQ